MKSLPDLVSYTSAYQLPLQFIIFDILHRYRHPMGGMAFWANSRLIIRGLQMG